MARKLRWTDVHDIAIELEEAHPEADNVNLRFTDLHRWVMALPDFEDDLGHSPSFVDPGRLDRRKRVNAPIRSKIDPYRSCDREG